MQKMLGYMRKAIHEFDLIKNGDRIAVGVSGGKDSLVLLKGLVLLRRFIGIDYEVVALTLDPGFNDEWTDFTPIQNLCDELGVEYYVERSPVWKIVFDIRKETHPCSLCAKMRRGALHDLAKEHGCNKIALGHNFDDVVETFVMNLFIEGRIGCFAPKSYLSRKDLYMIRPLVLAPEREVKKATVKNELPVIKSKCPADGNTVRERTKQWLRERERADNGFSLRLFGAMRRAGIDGWGYPEKRTSHKGRP